MVAAGKVQPRFVRERSRRMVRKQSRAASMSMVLLGNNSWELFEGIPKHYSLRTRIRMKIKYSSFGYFWEAFQTLFALFVSGLYVMQTYDATLNTDMFDLAALVVFSVDYLLNFYCCENRWKFVVSFTSILDAVTIIPALVDRITPADEKRRTLSFLRFIRVLRLLRLLRLIRATGRRSISAVQKQIHTIVLLITCIVFISAGVFHAVENAEREDSQQLTFGNALYFLIVTVATVGYGDVAPLTTFGKFVTAAVIIISFTIVPAEINRLTQLMALQSPFRKTYHPAVGQAHVLVVGNVTDPRSMLDFFKELYHPDRLLEDGASNPMSEPPCVIMGPHEPSEAIINMLDHPMLQNRVTYIKGSVMSEEDLCRVGADAARACFVLVEKATGNAKQIDAETVLRLLAIRNYNADLEVYTQIVSPTFSDYISEVDSDHVICLDQIKLSVMAKSCLCPGLVTLISNLFRSSTVATKGVYTGWEKEYIEGLALEVYATSLPPALFGLTFSQACDVLYQCSHGEVILLAVYERNSQGAAIASGHCQRSPSHRHSHHTASQLYINPGSTMLMAAGQIVYVLSESKKLTQTSSISDHLKNWLSAGNIIPLPNQAPKTNPNEITMTRRMTLRLTKRSQGELIIDEAIHPVSGDELTNHVIVVTELHESVMKTFIQLLRLARHVPGHPDYHPIVFLSWSSKSVTAACRVLQEYEDVFLMMATGDSKSELLRANILAAKRCVLLSDRATVQQLDGETIDSKTIFHYLAILSIQSESGMDTTRGLLPIVELTIPRTMRILDTALKKRTLVSHRAQEKMHMLERELHDPVQSAHEETLQTIKRRQADGNVFMFVYRRCVEAIDLVARFIKMHKRLYHRRTTIRQEQDSAKKVAFDSSRTALLPFFAAGYGFSDDIFDNMLCQSYFTPGLIRLINELLFSEEGYTSRSFRFETSQRTRGDSPEDIEDPDPQRVTASSLTQIPVPKEFVAKSYGEMFIHLVSERDIVAIGLYRGSGVPFTLPYVVAGPANETILAKDDFVYVLAQPRAAEGQSERRQPGETEGTVNLREVGLHLAPIHSSVPPRDATSRADDDGALRRTIQQLVFNSK
ncbi:TPA: hypothetical protein N0F65_002046 [Lagenidium giganteum]|uniref:BK channel n=1 Tax=Lagenidium giganteum TaxID=4803 RepID=A0AAV2ZEB0_9STRA|nr:TPA: hypothetical protein N0F65_002046 [Lagenidium giganteum]